MGDRKKVFSQFFELCDFSENTAATNKFMFFSLLFATRQNTQEIDSGSWNYREKKTRVATDPIKKENKHMHPVAYYASLVAATAWKPWEYGNQIHGRLHTCPERIRNKIKSQKRHF